MKVSERQTVLASMLMKQRGIKRTREYAKQLHISERTLYEDLKIVKEYLSTFGYNIVIKKGVGIRVEIIENKIEEKSIHAEVQMEDRKLAILRHLLFYENTITFEKAAEQFLVSKTSIQHDFSYIQKDYLYNGCCSLYSDLNGTRLVGTEEQFQKTFIRFNELCIKKIEVLLPTQEDCICVLKTMYGNDIVNSCYAVLYQITVTLFPLMAEYYMSNILNVLIVLTYRSKREIHMNEIKECESTKAMKNLVEEIFSKVEDIQKIRFTKEDFNYFLKNLIANRMEIQSETTYEAEIKTMITYMSKALDVSLSKDEKLYDQLSQHVPAMIFRLKENIHIQNPFLIQIKAEFTLMYHLTWLVLSSLEEQFKILFTENEIGFITLYFQLSLDRIQPSKRVLIVCPLGMTTTEMLSSQIKKLLPPLDIVYHLSVLDITELDLEKIDFIISTVPLKNMNKPLIVVSPLLNDDDLNNISELYKSAFVIHKEKGAPISTKSMHSFIKEEFIHVIKHAYSKQEILKFICNTLIAENYVKEEFLSSVMKREAMGSTSLATHVAIPHGNPAYVIKTNISIAVSEPMIKWGDEYVHVIILLSIANRDMKCIKEILKEIYRMSENKEIVKGLFLHKSKKELIKILGVG